VIATAGWYVCGDEQVHALLAHRKLATMFVERGGLALLLGLPRNTWTHAGVARCLYALSAVAVVIETCFIADAEKDADLARMCCGAWYAPPTLPHAQPLSPPRAVPALLGVNLLLPVRRAVLSAHSYDLGTRSR